MDLTTFKQIMKENGYLMGAMHGDRWSAIMPLMFTHAIVGGNLDTLEVGYDERWCYHNLKSASDALETWRDSGLVGEPSMWHRHPSSGRRREGGDPTKEVVRL